MLWGYCKLLPCVKFIVKLRHKFHIDSCLKTGAKSFCQLNIALDAVLSSAVSLTIQGTCHLVNLVWIIRKIVNLKIKHSGLFVVWAKSHYQKRVIETESEFKELQSKFA